MRGYRPSLIFSILASLACLLILTWILFSLFALKTAERDLYAQKGEHARMLLASFVNQLPDLLPTFPEGVLPLDSPAAIYGGKLAEERSLERITLLDSGGKVIYTAGRDGVDLYRPFLVSGKRFDDGLIIPDGPSLVSTSDVTRNGHHLGRAGLVLSLSDEEYRLKRSRQLFISYFAIDFILLLGIGSYILSKIVVTPVNRLLSATERITGGVYGHTVRVSGPLELARLAVSFNTMSLALKQKEEEVSSHLLAIEEASRNLHQAREEAVMSEKMASVGLLAAGTAHEIGTPLASVMGYAEILYAELERDPVHADCIQRILEGCGRIDRIVRGLLDYARPKSAAFQKVDAGRLVSDTVELLQHQGLFKNCAVKVDCEKGLPPLWLDPHQLQQVLINLLINGNDAMPDGGKLLVDLRISPPGKLPGCGETVLQIAVSDSGVGISRENMGRIFDPFFSTKGPGKGTGLGLAISSRIVESFGGKINVKSAQGQGSCFYIYLPFMNEGDQRV